VSSKIEPFFQKTVHDNDQSVAVKAELSV